MAWVDPDNRSASGPISQTTEAQEYLEKHNISQMFQSLAAALMVEQPEDHFKYLDGKLEEIKEKGVSNIDWETFVYDLHPTRDPVHKELIKADESEEQNKDIPQFSNEKPQDDYAPEVFKLTEPQE